jgi:hypothetical protein
MRTRSIAAVAVLATYPLPVTTAVAAPAGGLYRLGR